MARHGDETARTVVNETGEYLGAGLASLVNLFDPESIVLSGGIAQSADLLLPSAERVVRENTVGATCKIQVSGLGGDTGLIGAAALAVYGTEPDR